MLLLIALMAAGGFYRAARRYERRLWEQRDSGSQSVPAVAVADFSYGPVLERILEFASPNRRALNFASGDFATSTTDHPLDFRSEGSETLRRAGVDLFVNDAAAELITPDSAPGDKRNYRIRNSWPRLASWLGGGVLS